MISFFLSTISDASDISQAVIGQGNIGFFDGIISQFRAFFEQIANFLDWLF